MAKVKYPVTFGECYNIPSEVLDELGILNPTLAIDTKLFIDPLLMGKSSHPEINDKAVKIYRDHFTRIISLLSVSKEKNDLPWRNALRLFQFHELRGTCLGYGAASISGSGFGTSLINHVINTAKEIVDLGVKDPDLFIALALFESDIGPDRISDMTTNVIIDALIEFNQRILEILNIETKVFYILGRKCNLAKNPFHGISTPIILLPYDILRELPIATDWDEVCDVASRNEHLRNMVNLHISHIWQVKARRDKEILKEQALSSSQAFETLLNSIHSVSKKPYEIKTDPMGLIKWAEVARNVSSEYPIDLRIIEIKSIEQINEIVSMIISHFQFLIEKRGLWKNLWYYDNPLSEKYVQRLFFAISYSYCVQNDLDISPEVDTGSGNIDFKFSHGFKCKILVELKLSTNNNVVKGYINQLNAYRESEETNFAYYVVIDVGYFRNKEKQLIDIYNKSGSLKSPSSELIVIDGKKRKPASKL